ncbi:MAG: DUF2341 domain-containing protein [Balneolales bacterium]|nr:DUF2341 domain-containing protein [Balneolales bacterium]
MEGGQRKYHRFKSSILIVLLWLTQQSVFAQVQGYSQRLKAHVNAAQVYGDTDLTNFPVLISFTSSRFADTSNGGDVESSNGYDIIFTAADGTTILSHQIESYDNTTGEVVFWVRFPTLSVTTDTEFYAYFGNPDITTDPSSTNVWDSNYKMVLHLDETANGPTNFTDASGEISSTDISDNGTRAGTGQIGGSREFNDPGTNDVITIADNGVSPLDITGNITISFWAYPQNLDDAPDFITKGSYLNGYSIWYSNEQNNLVFSVNGDNLRTNSNILSDNTWYYVVVSRTSSGDRFIYLDGEQAATDNSTASFTVDDEDVTLSSFGNWPFVGLMDEVRISNIARDSAWIATEYANQTNQGFGTGFLDAINAEPILDSIETATLTYNSGDSPTIITSDISVYEGETTDNIESATIRITGNFDSTEDVLAFTNQLGITGSWNSTTGILTLTGTTTEENYQTALRSVTYENTDPAPVENTRTVSFTVNDGDDDSNTETRNIQVVKVNSAPTLSGIESSNILYFAGNGEKTITNNILVTDLDDTNLDSAFVQISSGYLSAEDTLRFTNQSGITGSWDDVAGQLKLEGTASLASYQAALRSITYENEAGSPTTTNRTISFSVHDGTEESSAVTRDIEYPTAITELASYKSIGVFNYDAQDADGDGDSATNQPSDGALSSWGDRSDNVSASTEDISATAPSGDAPTLSSSALGGRGAIIFDGNSGSNGDNYALEDNALVNTSSFTQKSFAAVFRTSDDLSGLQIIYEQGGSSNGYQISIKNGIAYAYAWSTNNSWTDGDDVSINLGAVETNTTYIIIANHNQPDNNTWQANINGGSIITSDLVAGTMSSHGGDPTIGEEDGSSDPTLTSLPSGTNNFTGEIAELVSWNSSLSSTDFTNIYAFLSDKWFNVPPVLSGAELTDLSYTEGDAATDITSTLAISDTDDTNLNSAKVYISSGFESSEDVLAYSTALGITGSYNSSAGVLILSGTTTVANYQAALRNVTYQNTETTSPTASTREISFIVYDWDDSSNVVTRDIDVTASNDAPVLANLEATTLAFTEGDAATDITSALTVSDNDNTTLQGATVAFTNNYFLGEDELAYTTALGITGSFNSSTGVLSLSGTTTLANYQAALRNVTFQNTSSDPVTGVNRTIEIRVFDGTDSSATGTTRDISVSSSNTVPTLANIETETIFYQANQSSTVSEAITITDPDDTNIESVTFQITSNYSSSEDTLEFQSLFGITSSWTDGTGTLTLTGPASKSDFQSAIRTVTYRNTISAPTDSDRIVSITANDGDGNSNTLTRTISFSIPKSVSDLLVWLKGDAGTFTTTGGSTASSDGTDVGRWEDQSGNNNHFTATNSGTEPTFRTNISTINSQDAVEFPGSSGYRLEDTDAENYLNGLDELTIFFVLESDDINTDQGFWTTFEPDATGEDKIFSIRYDSQGDNGSADDVITTGMRDLTTAFVMESFEAAQSNVGQIVMLKWTSELNYELYVDGVLSNPTFFQNIPTGTLAGVTTAIVGQGTQDLSSSWDGLIAEVILYGKELSTTEQEDIEDYLSAKYDIAIRSLTSATGGEAISADSSDVTNGYVTLTGPRVQESFTGEFSSGGTFVFNAPSGFEWDNTNSPAPSASVSSAFGGSTELTVSFTSRTTSQITFTIGTESSTNPGEITFSNFRVRPTTGVLPNTGNITNTGTTGLGGSTDYGELTMVAGAKAALEFSEQPSVSNVNSAISPAVRVQLIDQFGNAVEESQVNVSVVRNIVSGSGTLGGTTTQATNIFGIAEFDNLTLSATGSYTLTASSTGLTNTTSSAFDVVVIGALTGFTVERVPSGNISDKQAGQSFNITIVAVDGLQDTVDSFTGTISLSSNCTIGTGSGTSSSFTNGVLSSLTVSISSLGSCSLTATNSAGSENGTSNTFTVTPGDPSVSTTTISANPTVIFNDGFATSTLTVQTKDSEGNDVTTGGATITLSTTSGTIGPITDNSDGTYTATLTSSIVAGTATITGTLNGTSITDDAEVDYAEFNTQWQSQIGSISDARNWNDATNWSAGAVPGASDKVLIPANPSVGNEQPVISSTDNSVAQISIENSATITLSGGVNFTVTGEASGLGEILGSNTDSVTVGGDLAVSDVTVGFVKLDGSVNQDVTTPNDYVNLELDNANGADFTTNLSVSDTLKLTNGTLFLPSGTSLIANEKVYGTGEIRMQQRMYGAMGWRLLSSPIDTTYGEFLDSILTQGYSGSTLGNAALDSLQPNVLTYLESYPGTDNQRFRAPTSTSQKVTQGQGIFVFLFGNIAADSRYNDPLPDTLDVSGQEFDGNGTEVDFGITYTTAADSGWNLIGNPFLATIDWDDNTNWTKTNVESSIYIWDPSANGGNGEYLTWNGVTGTLPNAGLIPPFQGFWVKANANSPVLKVNKDAKTTGGSFLRKSMPGKANADSSAKKTESRLPLIDLAVMSSSGRSKRTNIMFSDEGLATKDPLDAYRLLPLTNSFIELHSLLDDGTELAINSLPGNFDSRLFIPLHVASYEDGVPISGELTFVWGDLRGVPEDWILTLVDNDTGQEINMLEEISYTFNHSTRSKIRTNLNPFSPNRQLRVKAATMDTRFTLKVSTEEIERDVPEEFYLEQNYPNPFNPSTNIEFGLNQNSRVTLEVWDILGRKVRTLIDEERTAGRYTYNFNARDLASGVYFYRLSTRALNGSYVFSGSNPSNTVITKKMVFIK